MASSFLRFFLDHTQRRTTVGRTPLDEWSARRRNLYLTAHNTHNRQTSMPPVGFEPTISAGERPQTYALDRAAAGTGLWEYYRKLIRNPYSATLCNIRRESVSLQVKLCVYRELLTINYICVSRGFYRWTYVNLKTIRRLTSIVRAWKPLISGSMYLANPSDDW